MTISFRKGGHIGFGVGTVHGAKLKDNQYAELFFDPRTRQVGVKFLPSASDHCYRVHLVRNSATIFAKPFCDYHKIPYDRASAFRLTWNGEERLYVNDRVEEVGK